MTTATAIKTLLTYEQFKTAYTNAFRSMMEYNGNQIGSIHFAEEMADLADAYPEWAEKVMNEAE